MDVVAPGGQDVYVAETGLLSFTMAHEEGVFPSGAYTTGFAIEPTIFGGFTFNFTGGQSSGFIACPIDNGRWEILATVTSEGAICAAAADVEIAAIAVSSPGAFEYE